VRLSDSNSNGMPLPLSAIRLQYAMQKRYFFFKKVKLPLHHKHFTDMLQRWGSSYPNRSFVAQA
jgi:hypothetical protein